MFEEFFFNSDILKVSKMAYLTVWFSFPSKTIQNIFREKLSKLLFWGKVRNIIFLAVAK